MGMDREEKIGLTTALGGHALLFIGMAFGLLMATDRIKEPPPMTVSLVGEDAVSAAPDPVQEEAASAAAASPAVNESPEPAQEEPAAVAEPAPQPIPTPLPKEVAKPVPKPLVKPIVKPLSKPLPKTVSKPLTKPVKKTTVKSATANISTTKTATRPQRGSAGLGDVINSVSKTGQGKTATATGTKTGKPAALSAAQVSQAVTVSLRAEIEPLFRRCAPSGVDVSDITTLVTLKIGKDKRLISASVDSQSGVGDSNRPQAPLLKNCALNAVRTASPYESLPDEGYGQWASWQMKFKTR
jgi:outer membrane biosynthesis protein TonB